MLGQDPELVELGKAIIAQHYPHLEPLNVAFMFKPVSELENGTVVAGRTTRSLNRDHALHGFDFVVEVGHDVWEELSQEQRYALMDHHVAFMGLRYAADPTTGEAVPEVDEETGRLRTYKRRPDVAEFEAILERHGAYTVEIRSFLRAFADRRKRKKDEEAAAKAAAEPRKPDAEEADLLSTIG